MNKYLEEMLNLIVSWLKMKVLNDLLFHFSNFNISIVFEVGGGVEK